MDNTIDVILTWVDGGDEKWKEEYLCYVDNVLSNEVMGRQRFEDNGSLRYIFRGIEKYMPWVKKIHFVTSGQVPSWLKTGHSKLRIVKHADIFPDNSMLPTFNSCAIEMCFVNIPDLAEEVVYFNDDTFVVSSVKKERLFIDGRPKDFLGLDLLNHDGVFSHILHSHMQLVNKEDDQHFKGLLGNIGKVFNWKYGLRRIVRNALLSPFPYYSLFEIYHHPQPLLKKYMEYVHQKYPLEVNNTMRNRFKGPMDLTQYIYRYINLLNGDFVPNGTRDTKYIAISNTEDIRRGIREIKRSKSLSFVCFNETKEICEDDYESIKMEMVSYLDANLPEKCSYER